jgi:hypothetical protein
MVPEPENIDIDLLSDVLDESIIWISERTGYSVPGIIPCVVKLLCRLCKDSGIDSRFGDALDDTAIDSTKLLSLHLYETTVLPVVSHVNAKHIPKHHSETESQRLEQLVNDNERKDRKIQEMEYSFRNIERQYEKKFCDAREINERILHENVQVHSCCSFFGIEG